MLALALGAFGQGKVGFGNDSVHLFVIGTPLSGDSGGGTTNVGSTTGAIPVSPLPSGKSLIAQLYVGTSAGSMSLYTSYVLDAANWSAPGRMFTRNLILDGYPANSLAHFNIVISDVAGALGSPFVPGPAAGAFYYGTSGNFTAIPPSSITYPSLVSPITQTTWYPANLVIHAVVDPNISFPPSSGSYVVGTNLVLSVGVSGTSPFSYQWRNNGVPVATNATLPFTNLALSDAGSYDVVVINSLGSDTSDVAIIQVLPTNAPSIRVNGKLAVGTVNLTGPASISIAGGFPGGFIFYSLDGSTPTAASTLYTGSFSMTTSGMIRAMSLSGDFTQSSEAPPVNVVIPPLYSLSTSVSGSGAIDVNPNASSYISNSVVTLTAVASANWAFDHWSGDLVGSSNPANITMDGLRSVQAVFVPTAYPLTLSTPGGGTVLANDLVIGANTYYPTSSVVQLQATPSNGWTFLSWLGSAASTANPFGLTMTQTQNVQAIFGTVVLTNIGGSGSVVMSATNPMPYGTTLTNWAVPASGYRFVTWSGAVSGTNSPATFAVTTAAPTVGALFAPLPATGGQLKNSRKIGSDFVCDLEGAASRNYQIRHSTNLVDWSDLLVLTNQTGTVSFTNAIEGNRRYYRAMLLP